MYTYTLCIYSVNKLLRVPEDIIVRYKRYCVFVSSLVRGASESSESGTRERLIMTNHTHNATPSHHQQLSSSHPNAPPLTPPGDLPLNTSAAHMCSHISSTQTRAHTPALTYFQSPGKNVDSSLNPCQGP